MCTTRNVIVEKDITKKIRFAPVRKISIKNIFFLKNVINDAKLVLTRVLIA
jgi:hypothetical protein